MVLALLFSEKKCLVWSMQNASERSNLTICGHEANSNFSSCRRKYKLLLVAGARSSDGPAVSDEGIQKSTLFFILWIFMGNGYKYKSLQLRSWFPPTSDSETLGRDAATPHQHSLTDTASSHSPTHVSPKNRNGTRRGRNPSDLLPPGTAPLPFDVMLTWGGKHVGYLHGDLHVSF